MRCIDFYATIEKSNPFLNLKDIESVIGLDTTRFFEAIEEDKINIESLFKSGLLYYSKWPNNLTEIYRNIYEH
jgi:hypothetical protein